MLSTYSSISVNDYSHCVFLKLYCCIKYWWKWYSWTQQFWEKTLVLKDFPIIENYWYYSRDRKSLLSDSYENKSVKTLTLVASRVTKLREKSKNSYENEKDFYKWGTCVEETIILAPEIFIEIHRGLTWISLLGWKRNRWRALKMW
jgi:hypothetical protein